jgi:hypothetical protein
MPISWPETRSVKRNGVLWRPHLSCVIDSADEHVVSERARWSPAYECQAQLSSALRSPSRRGAGRRNASVLPASEAKQMRCLLLLFPATLGCCSMPFSPQCGECCSMPFSPCHGEKVAEGRMREKPREPQLNGITQSAASLLESQPPADQIFTSSTRRFFARPGSSALSAKGWSDPKPLKLKRDGSTPKLTNARSTLRARSVDN